MSTRRERKKRRKARRRALLKKVGGRIKKFFPVTVAARNGILAAMKLNFKKIASKAKYGYLSQNEALELGLSADGWNKSAKIKNRLESIFRKLGGNPQNLRNAIVNGKGNKDGILSGIDELELGEPATATTIAAASSALVAILKFIGSLGVKSESDLYDNPEDAPFEEDSTGAEFEALADEYAETLDGIGIMIPLAIVAAAGAAYLLYRGTNYAVGAAQISKSLIIETSPDVSQIIKGIVGIKILMKNPTNHSITIKHPFVKLFLNESQQTANEPVISSKIEDKSYKIEKNAETSFVIQLKFGIGHLTILNELIKQYKAGKITLIVETETAISGAIPYTKVDRFEIPTKGGQNAS